MIDSVMTLKPRISEKTYAIAQKNGTYVFLVPNNVNKQSVAKAVSKQFSVTIKDVRVLNVKGKQKKTNVKRRRPIIGRQSDIKKAYVTLKSGDTIPVFAAIEKAEKQEAKEAAKAKKKGED